MKNFIKLTSIVSVSLVLVFFMSCTSNKVKENVKNMVPTSIQKDQVKEDVSEFIYPLPTAFEVTNILNKIGASYILSLSNPAENAEKYFTEKSRALNLGIYSADLSYASTYNQKQITIDYIKASNKLIDELGFSDIIDKNIFEEIENAENDKDKLIELITNTFHSSYQFLNKAGRGAVSELVLAGSWIEGLYIITHISEETYNNVEMVKLVMNQKQPLNKLMELLNVRNDNKDITETIDMLTKISSIYQEIEEGSITQEQMISITDEIAVIRASVVK